MTFTNLILLVLIISLSECGGHLENSNKTTKPCMDGDTIEISCADGHIIDVTWAIYQNSAGIGNTDNKCGDPNAKTKVENLCDGQQTCQITCDDVLFDQSTCEKKKEKMRVQYDCIRDPCETFYCANQGTCKHTSELQPTCECFGNWTGEHCDVSPCDTFDCDDDSPCLVNTETGLPQCSIQDEDQEQECVLEPCPDGFQTITGITDKCYQMHLESGKVRWSVAKNNCSSLNARLILPENEAEVDALYQYASSLSGYTFMSSLWTAALHAHKPGMIEFAGWEIEPVNHTDFPFFGTESNTYSEHGLRIQIAPGSVWTYQMQPTYSRAFFGCVYPLDCDAAK